MRSEQNRSIISRPLATTMILLASGLACSIALAGPKAKSGTLEGVQVQGRTVESVKIDDMGGTSSIGMVTSSRGIETQYFFRNVVIVQSNDWDAVASLVNTMPGIQLGRELGNKGKFRVIETSSVGAAFRVQRALQGTEGVISVEVDSGKTNANRMDRFIEATRDLRVATQQAARKGSFSNAQSAKGVIAVDDGSEPQSFPSTQWHFINTGGAAPAPDIDDWLGHDNNIPESIYDVLGDNLSGAGQNVGLLSLGSNMHLDVDHSELLNIGVRTGGYLHSLSMTADLKITPDNTYFTGFAGIIAAERTLPGPDIQGIAPGAGVATLYRGPTPVFEYDGFNWEQKDLGIKVHHLWDEYDTPGADYNEAYINEFVTDAFKNSYKFGRKGRGTINIFGTGEGFNLLPNPYTIPFGGSSEPWDGVAQFPNRLAVSVTNGFLFPGPLYVGGQTHQYPLANDRNALVINSVSEDGNVDSHGAVGPAIFASVYAGSSNESWSGSQTISGRGVQTIGAEDDLDELLPATLLSNSGYANMTGSVTAAGIVALMLEAKPNLLVRDIQHIFFQSIQESTRGFDMEDPVEVAKLSDIKWPHYDVNRVYYYPDASPFDPFFLRRSFWQTNTGFYSNSDAVPPVVNQSIRHSDQYGFGMIDAEIAIQKAKTWTGVKPLILLDTGIVGDVNLGGDAGEDEEDPRVPIIIEDAEFDVVSEADVLGVDGAAALIINYEAQQIVFCIRDNIRIESVVVELTIEGIGSNDLYMTLTSPRGTRTILSLPTTRNLSGQTVDGDFDDEWDEAFGSGALNDTSYAYYQHPFLTYKHWGELSGGRWAIDFWDYGPDEANSVGAEPGDPAADPAEPGGDMVILLGEIGVPGSEFREPKTVTAFRVKVYGTETGEEIFYGCDPGTTSCPGDLNGDGMIDTADFILFINWWQTGDLRADMNQDGAIDFVDLTFYRGIFVPGPCSTNQNDYVGGRPRPGNNDSSDTNPITRPI